MKREPTSVPKPTPAELELLRVLWARGPSTVREVGHALGDGVQIGYTSVLKFLQIMTAKSLVRRDEEPSARTSTRYVSLPIT